MAEVLCVYRKVNAQGCGADETEAERPWRLSPMTKSLASRRFEDVARSGARTRRSSKFARDHEYKRHGTVTLLAGIDLVTGKVHAML